MRRHLRRACAPYLFGTNGLSRGAAAVALALVLGACAAQSDNPSVSKTADDTAAEPNVVPVVQPDETGAPGTNAPANAAAPAKTAARTPRADELVGMKSGELTALLGEPNLVRTDRQAQVWQYKGTSCVLDLFLYPPKDAEAHGADAERAVVYIESRGKDARQFPGDRCISEVVALRGGAG
jgi:hypothetical protein